MIQERLNDAAIALKLALAPAGIKFGIFGGYAISVIGGPRESKDIDCLASVSKVQAIQLLDGKHGFSVIPQTRDDYVAFLWSDKPNRSNAVLVEIFCERFPGASFSVNHLQTTELPVAGSAHGTMSSSFLGPFHIFKGKVRAAALRSKFHDSADLRMLVGKYEQEIKARSHELNLTYVGLAIKKYSVLELLFQRIGVNVAAAKQAVKDINQSALPPLAVGGV